MKFSFLLMVIGLSAQAASLPSEPMALVQCSATKTRYLLSLSFQDSGAVLLKEFRIEKNRKSKAIPAFIALAEPTSTDDSFFPFSNILVLVPGQGTLSVSSISDFEYSGEWIQERSESESPHPLHCEVSRTKPGVIISN